MTNNTDCFDTELSLDQLKALTGGIKAPSRTAQPQRRQDDGVTVATQGVTGFPDLYGV